MGDFMYLEAWSLALLALSQNVFSSDEEEEEGEEEEGIRCLEGRGKENSCHCPQYVAVWWPAGMGPITAC